MIAIADRLAHVRIPNGTERHSVIPEPHGSSPSPGYTLPPSAVEQSPVIPETEDLFARFADLGLIGTSPALRKIFQHILYVSQCSYPALPVLITGETGVGKEIVSKAIHACDARRHKYPLIAVGCGTLTKELAPSHLFGHARGAFTGAMGTQDGYFVAAHNGTIQLDDVEALDSLVQPMLLRVLDEHRVIPVGTTTPRTVDVRVITTTNAPLPEMVLKGTFRLDLYYRLRGSEIFIPPLRDRPEDIEPQARHFLEKHQRQCNRGVNDITSSVLELFRRLPWRGNSRELSYVILEALSCKESGATLLLSDLPRQFFPQELFATNGSLQTTIPVPPPPRPEEHPLLLAKAKEQAELLRIKEALAKHKDNRLRAVRELGISRMGLYKKLLKYGIGRRASKPRCAS